MPSSKSRPSSRGSILKVNLSLETDFLLARQRAKQIAQLLGFELQDQTRIATAVSEIARNAWEYARGGQVEYFVDHTTKTSSTKSQPGARLRILVTDSGPGIAHLDQIWSGAYQSQTGMGIGLIGARRLLDHLDVTTGTGGTQVELIKDLPKHAPVPPSLASITDSLARASTTEKLPTTALHDQNQELLTLLGELRNREGELKDLNVELEETNRGVLVLYAELADKAQAVQQASEMKTRFLSGVTHELRTPLNSIVSLARLMLGHADGPLNPEQMKQVNFILRSAQSLTEMVNDLLDLAKIEAGKSSTVFAPFTVQDLFAALRGMFRPLATNPSVRLVFVVPEQRIDLLSDEGKLSQILRNFISNALKFTGQGSVTVSATLLDGNQIRFSVADTGIGIAPEHHELVMQEWGQVAAHPSGIAAAKGSGLGLPLSRSLAELLNGTLSFSSEPGAGSTFSVTLPALASPQPQPASSTPASPAAGHILIVDDDEVARYLLRRQLASLTSAPIEEVHNGEAALTAIAESKPQLVFLDLTMPGISGEDVARQLRAQSATANLPIVLHTSKILTPAEIKIFASLDLTLIPKRPTSGHTQASDDAQRVAMERALLEVGLSNLHDQEVR